MLSKIPHALRGLLLLGLLACSIYIMGMHPIKAVVMGGGALGGLCYLMRASAVTSRQKVLCAEVASGVWLSAGFAALGIALKAVL